MPCLTSRNFTDFFAHTEDHPVRVLVNGVLIDTRMIGFDGNTDTFVIMTGDQGYTTEGDRFQPEND